MDIATIIGLIVAIAAVLIGLVLSGGSVTAYMQLASAIIVFGGTLGSTFMSYPLEISINALSKTLVKVFKIRKANHLETVEKIVSFATIARKDGLLAIEKKLGNVEDRFLKKGLQLAVDGIESNKIIEIMEADLEEMEARHAQGINWFSTAGGYAPTFGIIGTVLGLIIALASMDSPEALGTAVAAAFLTTLYGIAAANLLFLPVAKKLKVNSEREMREKQLMMRGILGIQSGANPRLIKEELMAFAKLDAEKNAKRKPKKPNQKKKVKKNAAGKQKTKK